MLLGSHVYRNPFNDRVIASASEDGKVFLWEVPENFTLYTDAEEITDVSPVSKLAGHSRYDETFDVFINRKQEEKGVWVANLMGLQQESWAGPIQSVCSKRPRIGIWRFCSKNLGYQHWSKPVGSEAR